MQVSVDHKAKIHVQGTVPIAVEVALTADDVYNWILAQGVQDLAMLKTLRTQLNGHIRALENPDDDDFRSRA